MTARLKNRDDQVAVLLRAKMGEISLLHRYPSREVHSGDLGGVALHYALSLKLMSYTVTYISSDHRKACLGALQHLRFRVRSVRPAQSAQPHPDRGAGPRRDDLQIYEGEQHVSVSGERGERASGGLRTLFKGSLRIP